MYSKYLLLSALLVIGAETYAKKKKDRGCVSVIII